MNKLVLLLEDDERQARIIRKVLLITFAGIEIKTIPSEIEAIECFKGLTTTPFFVISDAMLPWSPVGDDGKSFKHPLPPDYPEDIGFRQAGQRCWTEFRKLFPSVLWFYFTVLDDATIEFTKYRDEHTGYIQKAGSIEPLLDTIRELLDSTSKWNEPQDTLSRQLWKYEKQKRKLLELIKMQLELDGLPDESDEEISARLLSNPKMREILEEGLRTPLSKCVPLEEVLEH